MTAADGRPSLSRGALEGMRVYAETLRHFRPRDDAPAAAAVRQLSTDVLALLGQLTAAADRVGTGERQPDVVRS